MRLPLVTAAQNTGLPVDGEPYPFISDAAGLAKTGLKMKEARPPGAGLLVAND